MTLEEERLAPWLGAPFNHLVRAWQVAELGHAPLIYGPEGLGKTALAQCLAKTMLCQQSGKEATVACGQCHSCQLMDSGTHPDFFEVKPAEDKRQIGVDQVRQLNEQLALTPALTQSRIGMIFPAETLNDNAGNALLKTLEEPPNNVYLILVTNHLQRLLPTILSRCQKFSIGMPDRSQALAWLKTHAAEAADSELVTALSMSAGAPNLALQMWEAGDVEAAHEVLHTLHAIAKGEGVSPGVAEQWALNPSKVWAWLAYWVSQIARSSVQGDEIDPMVSALTKGQASDWSGLWHDALEGRSLCHTGIRQDLLLSRWLLKWESIVSPS